MLRGELHPPAYTLLQGSGLTLQCILEQTKLGACPHLPQRRISAYWSYADNSSAPPYLFAANELDSATTPAGPTSPTLPTGQLRGQSDMSPSITLAISGVVNVSGAGTGPVARVSLTNAAAISITGISGAEVCEKIILHATTANAVTIHDGSVFELHGGTWTSSQFDVRKGIELWIGCFGRR